MKNYHKYLQRLPKTIESIEEMTVSPIYEDKGKHILYYAINDTDACAVVACPADYFADIKSAVSDLSDNRYTVKMVFICFGVQVKTIYIPNTVESIYGSEHLLLSEHPIFDIDDNHPYFEYRANNSCFFSKDGEDLIYGRFEGNFDSILQGVKTIHNAILCKSSTLFIPATVTKICRLEGIFTDVTFEGCLPAFENKALDNAEMRMIEVLTPKDESPSESIKDIMRVREIGDDKYPGYRRSEENTLFFSHTITGYIPETAGYIALTRADFEHDGETILINTQWIATIAPQRILRTDGEIIGSVVLVGLKGEMQGCCGISYIVYEPFEDIDKKITSI